MTNFIIWCRRLEQCISVLWSHRACMCNFMWHHIPTKIRSSCLRSVPTMISFNPWGLRDRTKFSILPFCPKLQHYAFKFMLKHHHFTKLCKGLYRSKLPEFFNSKTLFIIKLFLFKNIYFIILQLWVIGLVLFLFTIFPFSLVGIV